MIVVFTLPAMGHTKPMLPVLAGLVARGHRVLCFGHRRFESLLRASGAEFVQYPEFDYDIDAPDFNLIRMGADLIRASEVIYPKLLPEVSALSPRLIVQDSMALWASRIGTALGLPRIHTVPTLVFNAATQRLMRQEDGGLKLAGDLLRGAPSLVGAMMRSRFGVTVQEAFGLDGCWKKLAAPLCELVFNIEALQPGDPQGRVPRFYIGPTGPQGRRAEARSGEGYALVTFGTLSNSETRRFEAAVRGAAGAGYPVIALCGGKVDLAHLRGVSRALEAAHPDRTVTVLDHVPDIEPLIAGADIVIHHAGMATTWECVRHRKPALFIPTIADQKVLASRLERLGVGLRLPRGHELDARAIERSIAAARSRVQAWGEVEQRLAEAGGAAAGVRIITEALEAA